MKNTQRGFAFVPVVIILALLIIGGTAYIYVNEKTTNSPAINNNLKIATTTSDQNKNSNINTSKQATNYTPPDATLTILKPNINETWEIGTPHNIQWKLDTDFSRLHGTLGLSLYLQDKSGKLIYVGGRTIGKNSLGSSTITTSYYNSEIVPGIYQLIFKITDYDEISCNTSGSIPPGNVQTNCIGYSPIIASATSTAEVTLTSSSGHVAPFLSSVEPNQIDLGDVVSLSGVAFQPDSRVIFEGGYRSQDTWPMRIAITPQFISTEELKFTVPEKCNPPDKCTSQDVKIEPYVYRVTVETKYGQSNAVVLYLKH